MRQVFDGRLFLKEQGDLTGADLNLIGDAWAALPPKLKSIRPENAPWNDKMWKLVDLAAAAREYDIQSTSESDKDLAALAMFDHDAGGMTEYDDLTQDNINRIHRLFSQQDVLMGNTPRDDNNGD